MLVIGTSGVVYPAAGYAWEVKMQGGKIAVFNIERDPHDDEMRDWMFQGISWLCGVDDRTMRATLAGGSWN